MRADEVGYSIHLVVSRKNFGGHAYLVFETRTGSEVTEIIRGFYSCKKFPKFFIPKSVIGRIKKDDDLYNHPKGKNIVQTFVMNKEKFEGVLNAFLNTSIHFHPLTHNCIIAARNALASQGFKVRGWNSRIPVIVLCIAKLQGTVE
ncbi:MAG: hypothetical protein ACRBBN_20685 [Methyloligellaceae bacterium]